MKEHKHNNDFFQGTTGFPLRILLDGLSADDLAAITTIDLTFQRPDWTEFTHTATPADIIAGALQYLFADGDLSLPGGYRYKAVFNLSGARILTGGGSFHVKPTI